jgi:hypothetical protein
MAISITTISYQRDSAEHRIFIVMPSVVKVNDTMLSVVMLDDVVLSVAAPLKRLKVLAARLLVNVVFT